jgi:hypothetical protein
LLVACGGGAKKPAPIENTSKTKTPHGFAKVLTRTASAGVIELQGDRGAALDDANNHMARHCGDGAYQIVQEGEEAIDESTAGSREIMTVWRVHYLCSK